MSPERLPGVLALIPECARMARYSPVRGDSRAARPGPPIGGRAQDPQQLRREHDVAVLAAIASLDADQRPAAINGSCSQANNLADPQARHRRPRSGRRGRADRAPLRGTVRSPHRSAPLAAVVVPAIIKRLQTIIIIWPCCSLFPINGLRKRSFYSGRLGMVAEAIRGDGCGGN